MKAVRPIVLGLTFLFSLFLDFTAVALSQNSSIPALPREMAEQVSAGTGQPVILQQSGVLVWGLSTKTVSYGQPIPILLWLYNPTDKPQSVMTCSDIGWFWTYKVSVFDSSGQRVLSLKEQEIRSNPSLVDLPLCGRNFAISVPPHTSMHGSFSTKVNDFSWNLREYYSLSPGRYVIVASELDQNFMRTAKTLSNSQSGLQVNVVEP